jgi:murein DD-endopeptidase MepM/ murein hydrolase activator NlpD
MILRDVSVLRQPHHTYPAWDWIIPINTPIYAVRGGRVVGVHQWPHNWWDRGCGSNQTGCVPCGIGLTIADSDNTRWTYCHGTSLTVTVGDTVAAGDQVMWSGNTGRSGTSHLHLEIRTPDGARRCPQPLLQSLAQGSLPQRSNLSSSGCWFG